MDQAHAGLLGHIYVARGCAGLLKVGMTINPNLRKAGLAREFRARGDALRDFHAVGPIPCARGAELALISAISSREPLAFGREWFCRGNFPNAVRALEEVAAHYAAEFRDWRPIVVSDEAREWCRRHAADRARSKALGAEMRVKARAAIAHRSRLRNCGLHAFGQMAEELRGDVVWARIPDETWPKHGRPGVAEGRPTIDVAAPALQEVDRAAA